ncbi:origin recognition complex subunit 2 isoform X2 [Chrysoperla carnea]|uniref:origin recognition complex subunit 2 isoform X2 n=1 Tax=Chrysoperla carnea TaxID=189513 RepID=UPI001D078807|nr:origin recognition complex subunit 2 isoform X2 [Chrysoperla carnea]
MEERNRRKSKLTLINNDFRDEEPIYISNSEKETPKENKKSKNKKQLVYKIITSESDDEDNKIQKNQRNKSKKPSKAVLITSSESDNRDENQKHKMKSPTKKLQQSSPDKIVDDPELWKPVVILEKLTLDENQFSNSEKSATESEEISTKKTPLKKKGATQVGKLIKESDKNQGSSKVNTSSEVSTPKTPSKKKKVTKLDQLIEESIKIQNSPKKNEIITETPIKTSRRSGRPVKLSMKALESSSSYRTPTKKTISSSSSESEFEVDEDIEKPTVLFESKDVEGKQIYGFHTPKKRTALLQKAISVANSPLSALRKETEKMTLTPRTPKSTTKKYDAVKTPAAIRNKVRKKLEHVVRELEDEDFSDFSPSESDYDPSNSSSSSSSDSDNSDVEEKEIVPVTPKQIRNVRSTRKSQKEITYSLQSDDYFSTQNTKVFTSDNTLDKLKNPRLTQDKINDILQNVKTNREHVKKITELSKEYETYFEKWLCLMYEGHFSILLYGLGSKRTLLEHFRLYLQNENSPVIFINGFFPSLVIKDVIDLIANDLLRLKDVSSNPLEAIDEIDEFLVNNDEIHIFLIVCNIDGEMLRSSKTQNILSKLASIKNVHMIASIDNINAPLIWDHKKLNRYNFTWWDTTTFLPYAEETSFEGSLLVQKSGTLTLSSLKNIFQSLTTNARGIFNIIIKHHLDNKKDAHYQGISFKDLYWSCREAFLVSSDIALRAQLTEFLDHKLIKSKRNLDGAELLHIPIEGSLLQHFLDHE